jgi:hypothetical protein
MERMMIEAEGVAIAPPVPSRRGLETRVRKISKAAASG